MPRILIVLSLVMVALGVTGLSHRAAAAPTPPNCFDYKTGNTYPATKWLPADQPGTLVGTSGPDVLVGSDGSDVIKGLGGNDIICGNDFDNPNPGLIDTIYGGSGNDDIEGIAYAYGDSGNDYLLVFYAPSYGHGGSGNDFISAQAGASANGDSGNDTIVSTNGGADQLLGGSGEDIVDNQASANFIDCGSNIDQVNPGTTPPANVKRCEEPYVD